MAPHASVTDFGGLDARDDYAALLDANRKPVNQFAADGRVCQFNFRQHVFSRQASQLFNLQRPAEVPGRGHSFILFFARILTQHENNLPFCMQEIWVINACLALVKATCQHFSSTTISNDAAKDFYRRQGDLYSYARTKLMRLADLIEYGHKIETGPCNSLKINGSPAADRIAVSSPPSSLLIQTTSPENLSSSPEDSKEKVRLKPRMNFPEVHATAEHVLLTSISDTTLRTALSSVEGFEIIFLTSQIRMPLLSEALKDLAYELEGNEESWMIEG